MVPLYFSNLGILNFGSKIRSETRLRSSTSTLVQNSSFSMAFNLLSKSYNFSFSIFISVLAFCHCHSIASIVSRIVISYRAPLVSTPCERMSGLIPMTEGGVTLGVFWCVVGMFKI